jgi:hypothetical protein
LREVGTNVDETVEGATGGPDIHADT